MQVITKIRIALVALAVVLFFGGLHSAIKTSHIVVVRAGEPGMPGTSGASVEFVVSKSSRGFGIIRFDIRDRSWVVRCETGVGEGVASEGKSSGC
jgi:hypothetical protein